ncbi:phage capsid protein [Labrenzia sp. DG1229]|uniref:phage capsid protein n=1 Tax=Labrenzia sp. DG1229 TaxID=681847 RepID=UPI000560082A|nr:phage capsid protein [Labrenzia sp. DG1229]
MSSGLSSPGVFTSINIEVITMSAQAPEWFRTQYPARAMHIYQERGNRLRPTVSPAVRFEGSSKAIFYLAGKMKAKKKTRNERNTPSGSARKKFEVDLYTWTAFDEVEEWDMDRMSVDEREIVFESGAMALGRATDIEVYQVMAAAQAAVPADLDFSASNFNAAHAMTLCKALQQDKVPWDGNVYCGLPALQWNQFLGNKVVNSSDHVGTDVPFVKATDTRFWNGVNWFLFEEEEPEDLYPVPGVNEQDLFIWHKSAMGWGSHTDLQMREQWDNRADVWTINLKAKGAAKELQEGKGIKRFRTKSDGTIAIV